MPSTDFTVKLFVCVKLNLLGHVSESGTSFNVLRIWIGVWRCCIRTGVAKLFDPRADFASARPQDGRCQAKLKKNLWKTGPYRSHFSFPLVVGVGAIISQVKTWVLNFSWFDGNQNLNISRIFIFENFPDPDTDSKILSRSGAGVWKRTPATFAFYVTFQVNKHNFCWITERLSGRLALC